MGLLMSKTEVDIFFQEVDGDVAHPTNPRTSVVISQNLSLSFSRNTDKSWPELIDSIDVVVGTKEYPSEVFADTGNRAHTTIILRNAVIVIFVFVCDATLIMWDKE